MNLDFSRPRVMAIVNVTPDSFYAGSRKQTEEAVADRVREALTEGADMLDVGGYSSRPGADPVSVEEEWRRVDMGISEIRKQDAHVVISVDTFRAEVARRAVAKYGELIINDISAGELDAEMLPTVASLGVPYLAMHMKGDPQTMQSHTDYQRDITTEVVAYFEKRCCDMQQAGIAQRNILLDPGFGFAKTLEQNYELLGGLSRLKALGYPILVGLSRKSMIYKALDTTPQVALAGTIALDWECLRQGAVILRVHDVQEACDTVRLFEIYKKATK